MPRMYQVLNANKPKITDDFKIELQLASESQKTDFKERIEGDLIGFLKKNMKNKSISLNVVVSEKTETNKLIYSSADKFKYLIEKNKLLENLTQTLNLNFE